MKQRLRQTLRFWAKTPTSGPGGAAFETFVHCEKAADLVGHSKKEIIAPTYSRRQLRT